MRLIQSFKMNIESSGIHNKIFCYFTLYGWALFQSINSLHPCHGWIDKVIRCTKQFSPEPYMELLADSLLLIPLILWERAPTHFHSYGNYFLIYIILGIFLILTRDALYLNFFYYENRFFFTIILNTAGIILLHKGMLQAIKGNQAEEITDRWNQSNESFPQNLLKIETKKSINIKMQFSYKKQIRNGWFSIPNPFRGTLLMGTPGSGKTYSIVEPFIRQMIDKEYAMLLYDFKYPDLAEQCYKAYHIKKKQTPGYSHRFHTINLAQATESERVNPLQDCYIKELSDAIETADALLHAIKKDNSAGESDQFFTQSAINFLSAAIYFFSKFQHGKYCSFPHVLSFLNFPYEEMMKCLFSMEKLQSLVSPFRDAYLNKSFEQLDGQLGTLRIFLGRICSPETYWILSGNDFSLKISDKEEPAIVILASNPQKQEINSVCASLIINRILSLLNSKGNQPSAIIIDEMPTIYIHRVENLLATARSNRIAILMSIQEIPQLIQQYGRNVANTIISVSGNIISGAVKNATTLSWLEKNFGRTNQFKLSFAEEPKTTHITVQEHMDTLIPASVIASLKPGEIVAQIAQEDKEAKMGAGFYKCKIKTQNKLDGEDLPTTQKASLEEMEHNFKKINTEVRDIIKQFKQTDITINDDHSHYYPHPFSNDNIREEPKDLSIRQ